MSPGLNPFVKVRAVSPHNQAVVTCSRSYWNTHIVSRHREMEGQEALVEKTINDPLSIYQSDTHTARHVFYRPSELPPPLRAGFIRVIVEYDSEGKGTLLSAFHVMSAKFRETVMLWPQS